MLVISISWIHAKGDRPPEAAGPQSMKAVHATLYMYMYIHIHIYIYIWLTCCSYRRVVCCDVSLFVIVIIMMY